MISTSGGTTQSGAAPFGEGLQASARKSTVPAGATSAATEQVSRVTSTSCRDGAPATPAPGASSGPPRPPDRGARGGAAHSTATFSRRVCRRSPRK